jgi:hypothetical protein
MMETNIDESLRVLLRLLIDEIVEDLSRSGTGSRSRSFSKDTSRFQRADKTIETGK